MMEVEDISEAFDPELNTDTSDLSRRFWYIYSQEKL
jgi:hypothetical protein